MDNSYESINLKLKLTDETRNLLNSQEIVKNETQFNVTLMDYNDYEKDILSNTTITKKILELLFNQYPEYYKIRDKLVISTFRTNIITSGGLNGETGFHRDNILFAEGKDRNLIISWKVGTESFTLEQTRAFIESREKFMCSARNFNNNDYYDNNKDKWCGEYYAKKHNLKLVKSQCPNLDGDIDCLVISGKEVFHKREDCSKELEGNYYRYALNIYYSFSDLPI